MKLIFEKLADTYYVSLFPKTRRSCSGMRFCLGELMWLWEVRLGIVSMRLNISRLWRNVARVY